MEIEKVKAALEALVAEIRHTEAAFKEEEELFGDDVDPVPYLERLAFLHAVRVATIKKLAAEV